MQPFRVLSQTGGWRNNTTMFESPTLDTKHAVSIGVGMLMKITLAPWE
jgi:hypothetical protein